MYMRQIFFFSVEIFYIFFLVTFSIRCTTDTKSSWVRNGNQVGYPCQYNCVNLKSDSTLYEQYLIKQEDSTSFTFSD